MLTCIVCKQRIQAGQVFAEVNMTKLLKTGPDELSMEHVYDEDECILHKECFKGLLSGSPVPDPQDEVESPPLPVQKPVQRTNPLEFFDESSVCV